MSVSFDKTKLIFVSYYYIFTSIIIKFKYASWTTFFCNIYFILINYAYITIQIAKQSWIMSPYSLY